MAPLRLTLLLLRGLAVELVGLRLWVVSPGSLRSPARSLFLKKPVCVSSTGCFRMLWWLARGSCS